VLNPTWRFSIHLSQMSGHSPPTCCWKVPIKSMWTGWAYCSLHCFWVGL
jgi:hypothetical protein